MADASTYTTSAGDVVDLVAYTFYGTLDGAVLEKVYEANRGLAARGLVLPAGIVITLPVIEPPSTRRVVSLFGGG